MFWILVLACGGAGDSPEVASSEARSIFDQGEAPATPPAAAVEAPSSEGAGLPSEKLDSLPAPKVPKPSRKCVSARKSLDAAESRVVQLRNARVSPASDRVDDATALLSRCVRDIDWCGNRAADYKKSMLAAEGVLEEVLDTVAREEAKLFPLVQAVERACNRR